MGAEPIGPGGGEPASAPPAAPAPVAPDSGSAPAPGPASGSPDPGASAAGAGDEVKRTQIKPIPLRDKDGTFKGPTGSLHRHELGFKPKSDRDASPERQFPGKAKAPEAPLAAKLGEVAPALPADQAPAAPKPAPFKFAGKDWESPEQAEQSFRTLQGQFRPLTERLQTEERKAAGWYTIAQQHERELTELRAGRPASGPAGSKQANAPGAASPDPSGDPTNPLSGIDMGVYELLAKDPNNGPAIAAAWLAGEVAKNQSTRTEALIAEAIAPFREEQQRRAETNRVVSQVENLHGWASSQRNEDGSPVFAEFGDPAAEREMGEIVGQLVSLGLPEQVALSPVGLSIASALRSKVQGAARAPQQSPANPAAAAVASALLSARPGADPVSGPSAATTQPGQPMTREDRVKQEMRTARQPDPDLGFPRRQSAPI